MTGQPSPAVVALAASAGVDPTLFADPAVAAYFGDIAQAVAMLGIVPPPDPDTDAPFDPAWPDEGSRQGGPS